MIQARRWLLITIVLRQCGARAVGSSSGRARQQRNIRLAARLISAPRPP
jgi:hypothetical protein